MFAVINKPQLNAGETVTGTLVLQLFKEFPAKALEIETYGSEKT